MWIDPKHLDLLVVDKNECIKQEAITFDFLYNSQRGRGYRIVPKGTRHYCQYKTMGYHYYEYDGTKWVFDR